jgi:hypothetical protein
MRSSLAGTIFSIAILLSLLTVGMTTPVQADIAPPEQPTGANLVPGQETTRVRMLSEQVIIEIQLGTLPVKDNSSNIVNDWAKVTASFQMQNTGSSVEKMDVRFPLTNLSGFGDGFGNQSTLENFLVEVDGVSIEFKTITINNTDNLGKVPIKWASFPVMFSINKTTNIVVTYQVRATGYSPFAEFGYILETGSGWKDTIGEGKIIVRLPYVASGENLLLDQSNTGFEFEGNDAIYTFKDLEPTKDSNIHVTIVEPAIWLQVLSGRQAVVDHPNDGQSWGKLAEALRKSISYAKPWQREDPAGIKLFEESVSAYNRAVNLAPDQFVWHYGYANLIWQKEYFHPEPDMKLIQRMLEQFSAAYSIDPRNEDLYYQLKNISETHPEWITSDGNKFHFPIVSDAQIIQDTLIPEPENTPEKTEQPVEVSTPSEMMPSLVATNAGIKEKGKLPFCCPSIVLPLSGVVFFRWLQLIKKKEI